MYAPIRHSSKLLSYCKEEVDSSGAKKKKTRKKNVQNGGRRMLLVNICVFEFEGGTYNLIVVLLIVAMILQLQ